MAEGNCCLPLLLFLALWLGPVFPLAACLGGCAALFPRFAKNASISATLTGWSAYPEPCLAV